MGGRINNGKSRLGYAPEENEGIHAREKKEINDNILGWQHRSILEGGGPLEPSEG